MKKNLSRRPSVRIPLAHPHAAVFHGIDDVFFHQSAGDAQAFGDLQMAQAVQLAQQETLAADRRQFGQSALKQFQALGLIVAGVGRAGGEALFAVQHLQLQLLGQQPGRHVAL